MGEESANNELQGAASDKANVSITPAQPKSPTVGRSTHQASRPHRSLKAVVKSVAAVTMSARKHSRKRALQPRRVRAGEWKLATGKPLAAGNFGTVYLGMNTTGQLLAVKEIIPQIGNLDQVTSLMEEVELMKALEHPNIVAYLGAEVRPDPQGRGFRLYILQEWSAGGSLAELLRKFGKFDDEKVVERFVSQILSGIGYLHDEGIMHRDIKGDNILVDADGTVKIADFGASKRLSANGELVMTTRAFAGTPYFMAPEVTDRKLAMVVSESEFESSLNRSCNSRTTTRRLIFGQWGASSSRFVAISLLLS